MPARWAEPLLPCLCMRECARVRCPQAPSGPQLLSGPEGRVWWPALSVLPPPGGRPRVVQERAGPTLTVSPSCQLPAGPCSDVELLLTVPSLVSISAVGGAWGPPCPACHWPVCLPTVNKGTIHGVSRDTELWERVTVSSSRHCRCSGWGRRGAGCRLPFTSCSLQRRGSPQHRPLHGLEPLS